MCRGVVIVRTLSALLGAVRIRTSSCQKEGLVRLKVWEYGGLRDILLGKRAKLKYKNAPQLPLQIYQAETGANYDLEFWV